MENANIDGDRRCAGVPLTAENFLQELRKKSRNIPNFYGLAEDDITVLMEFNSHSRRTLGQMLSSTGVTGSRMMESIEKLFDFGCIARDCETESKNSFSSAVYKITHFGKKTATAFSQTGPV